MMSFFFGNGCVDLFATLLAILICIVTYFKWSFTYWKRKNIPYIQPQIPWGTFGDCFVNRRPFADMVLKQYRESKSKNQEIVGIFAFSNPMCIILEPSLIRGILSTGFNHFMNRGIYSNEKHDPLSAGLFAIEGSKWKTLRAKLTPTFTSGRLKMMFNIFVECSDELKDNIVKVVSNNEPVEIKDKLERYTINIIGSSAFGLDCESFSKVDTDFIKYVKTIFRTTKLQAFKATAAYINPTLAHWLGICVTPKEASDFFLNIIKNTVDYREKNKITRDDFMQLLINLKNEDTNDESENNSNDSRLTFEELAAQAFVFFVAGFEASSSIMTFVLYELAINPEIQNKLKREVTLYNEKLTYEAIGQMKYLDQVIDETLRKYPPVAALTRKCNEDYGVPGTDIIIQKGVSVFIPIIGLHHDSEYYPNPEHFDPERFSSEKRESIVPYTYMPFGEGPRICIGLRFAILQTKVGLATLLQHFKFSLNEQTKIPMKMDPTSFVQSPLDGVWLNVEKV